MNGNVREIQGLVHWHIIDFEEEKQYPDEGEIVLVYDEGLNDVIEAQALTIDDEMDFYDTVTGERLPAPLWWARKPFPKN
jgi:hypothetical protein